MLKRTTEEVRQHFAEHGCELLDEYRGVMVPMNYKCKCGHMAKTSWNNFTKGKRCGYCHLTGRKKKYTFEEVKEIFASHGCTLLATSYFNNQENLKCLCKCSRPWSVSLAVVMKGVKCYECGLEKIRRKADATREENKAYRKLYYRYKKSLKRTLEAIGLNKMDYSHKLLGYTARELKEHIEHHPNWPKVKNKNWHLDHIFPIKAFADYGISDVKLINALDNLQPLTQRKNNQKCDFYIKKDFEAWLATHS